MAEPSEPEAEFGVAEAPASGAPPHWRPKVASRKGVTKHKLLTDQIIADIDAGTLPPRYRMPPHRDLARMLGVSVQTVSLGYKEAERRGYLTGEVGRGTFVRSRIGERADHFMLDRTQERGIDLSIVRAVYTEAHERASRAIMAELAQADNAAFMDACRPIAGLDRHRDAAQAWLRRLGVDADPERILITNGAAHGVFLALATLVRPGDVVLTENLTDHGVIGLSNVLGFTLKGLATDREGVLPEAFAEACAAGNVIALVLIPTLGNPTSHVAGAERRREIARIADRHGVFVVEDEVCKPLLDTAPPSITAMLPHLGFFVTSFTKSVMTGLRIGYLVVPPQFSIRVGSVLRVTSWSATNMAAEVAARWIENGTADALLAAQRLEIRARQAIVADTLGPLIAGGHPLSLSAWLKVPERWSEEALVAALQRRGIAVTPSDPFVASEKPSGGGIRICIGGRLSHPALRDGLMALRSTCEQLPPLDGAGSIR
jgi:DNA-binding transcriptional MocR family regulator